MEKLVIVCLAVFLAVTFASSLPRAIKLQSHFNEEGKFFSSIANFGLGVSFDRLVNEVKPKSHHFTYILFISLKQIIVNCSLPC